MKKLLLGGVLALSLAMNASFGVIYLIGTRSAKAAPGGDTPASGAGSCPMDAIPLKEGQRAQLAEIRADMPALRLQHRKTMAELRFRLGEALAAERPDRPAIAGLLDQYSGAQRALQQRAVEHLLQVRELLDDTQRQEFRRMLQSHLFEGLRQAECDRGGMQ